jgi:hypothetical protein
MMKNVMEFVLPSAVAASIKTYNISGYVLTEAGNPVVGAEVKLIDQLNGVYDQSVYVNSKGKYSFNALEGRDYKYRRN